MTTIFFILLGIHILAAVYGFGPMFQTGLIRRTSTNLVELQHSLNILKRTGKAPKHSLVLVALTGVGLVGLAHLPGNQGWLLTSVALLFVLIIFLWGVFPYYYEKMGKLVTEGMQAGTTELPTTYQPLEKKLRFWEYLSLLIVAVIFLLMIIRPF